MLIVFNSMRELIEVDNGEEVYKYISSLSPHPSPPCTHNQSISTNIITNQTTNHTMKLLTLLTLATTILATSTHFPSRPMPIPLITPLDDVPPPAPMTIQRANGPDGPFPWLEGPLKYLSDVKMNVVKEQGFRLTWHELFDDLRDQHKWHAGMHVDSYKRHLHGFHGGLGGMGNGPPPVGPGLQVPPSPDTGRNPKWSNAG